MIPLLGHARLRYGAMKIIVKAALGIVGVLGVLCVAHSADPDQKEVVVEGRPLRSWLEERWTLPSIEEGEKVEDVLARFCADPEKAVPALAAALTDKNEKVRRAAVLCLGRNCKVDAKTILPTLLTTLREDKASEVREAAVTALSRIGPKDEAVLAALIRAFKKDEAAYVRSSIILEFRSMKPKTVFPVLKDALKDPDAWVRAQAVFAVVELEEPKTALPLVIEAFEDKDGTVREVAASAVGRYCLPETISALRKGLKDKNPCVRIAALQAMGETNAEVSSLIVKEVSTIIALMDDKDSDVRRTAAITLGRMKAVGAVPTLIAKLDDKELRSACVFALGDIGSDAAEAVDKLIKLLKDPDADLRFSTAEALGQIGPKAKAAVPALIEALNDEELYVRRHAVYALGNIGPMAKAAIPKLQEMLKIDDQVLKGIVETALKKINKVSLAK